MSTVWDRLKSGPSQNDSSSSGSPAIAGLGGGSARGAYYGGLSTTTGNLNFNNGAKYSYSIKGGPAPPRPPREFVEQQQQQPHQSDDLLFVSDARNPPPRNPQRGAPRDSSFRPTSSIYSQPGTLNTNFRASHQRRANEAEDISPPSSPEVLTPRDGFLPHHIPSPDISPIDDFSADFIMSQHNPDEQASQPSRSNIPMMRRERRQDRDQVARTLRESRSRERLQTQMDRDNQTMLSQRGYKGGEVRWDPRTGELTSSAKGRPGQVKPAEYAKGLANSPPTADTDRHQEPPRGPSAFGERMRMIAKGGSVDRSEEPLQSLQNTSSTTDPAFGAFSSERPAWHGASGRTTLVAPVKDTKDVAPLVNIPRKSSKRVSTALKHAANGPRGGLDTIMASPPVSPPPGAETLGRETIRQVVPSSQLPKPPPQQAHAYPSPPLSGDISAAAAAAVAQDSGAGAARDRLPALQEPSPSSPSNNHHQIKRKPAAHLAHDSVSSVYSQSDPFNYNHYTYGSGSTPPPPPVPAHQEWSQPPSRFSVTTYDATPRESLDEFDPRDAPPVPSVSDMFRSSPAAAKHPPDSIMDRRRPPKLGHTDDTSAIAFDEPIVISLDPWTTSVGGSHRDKVKPARRPGQWDAGSVHKVLPPAPPEQSAKDRLAQLNAQLSGLAQRRANIARSIEQMTKLMPTDSIMASAEVIHKREMEKRKVEGLKTELSEVQREEYELGLKLHRAYKRMDREAEFEPTTLWVRRVTH